MYLKDYALCVVSLVPKLKKKTLAKRRSLLHGFSNVVETTKAKVLSFLSAIWLCYSFVVLGE